MWRVVALLKDPRTGPLPEDRKINQEIIDIQGKVSWKMEFPLSGDPHPAEGLQPQDVMRGGDRKVSGVSIPPSKAPRSSPVK